MFKLANLYYHRHLQRIHTQVNLDKSLSLFNYWLPSCSQISIKTDTPCEDRCSRERPSSRATNWPGLTHFNHVSPLYMEPTVKQWRFNLDTFSAVLGTWSQGHGPRDIVPCCDTNHQCQELSECDTLAGLSLNWRRDIAKHTQLHAELSLVTYLNTRCWRQFIITG